jgi:hypothetical protein
MAIMELRFEAVLLIRCGCVGGGRNSWWRKGEVSKGVGDDWFMERWSVVV